MLLCIYTSMYLYHQICDMWCVAGWLNSLILNLTSWISRLHLLHEGIEWHNCLLYVPHTRHNCVILYHHAAALEKMCVNSTSHILNQSSAYDIWEAIVSLYLFLRQHSEKYGSTPHDIYWISQVHMTYGRQVCRCIPSCWIICIPIAFWYVVASASRIEQILGLFCKRTLWKRLDSAQETCNLVHPTQCRHPTYDISHDD